MVGDGKIIQGFVLEIPLEIGNFILRGPIAFSPELKIGFNLLGRSGIFDFFTEVAFQGRRHKIIFRRQLQR